MSYIHAIGHQTIGKTEETESSAQSSGEITRNTNSFENPNDFFMSSYDEDIHSIEKPPVDEVALNVGFLSVSRSKFLNGHDDQNDHANNDSNGMDRRISDKKKNDKINSDNLNISPHVNMPHFPPKPIQHQHQHNNHPTPRKARSQSSLSPSRTLKTATDSSASLISDNGISHQTPNVPYVCAIDENGEGDSDSVRDQELREEETFTAPMNNNNLRSKNEHVESIIEEPESKVTIVETEQCKDHEKIKLKHERNSILGRTRKLNFTFRTSKDSNTYETFAKETREQSLNVNDSFTNSKKMDDYTNSPPEVEEPNENKFPSIERNRENFKITKFLNFRIQKSNKVFQEEQIPQEETSFTHASNSIVSRATIDSYQTKNTMDVIDEEALSCPPLPPLEIDDTTNVDADIGYDDADLQSKSSLSAGSEKIEKVQKSNLALLTFSSLGSRVSKISQSTMGSKNSKNSNESNNKYKKNPLQVDYDDGHISMSKADAPIPYSMDDHSEGNSISLTNRSHDGSNSQISNLTEEPKKKLSQTSFLLEDHLSLVSALNRNSKKNKDEEKSVSDNEKLKPRRSSLIQKLKRMKSSETGSKHISSQDSVSSSRISVSQSRTTTIDDEEAMANDKNLTSDQSVQSRSSSQSSRLSRFRLTKSIKLKSRSQRSMTSDIANTNQAAPKLVIDPEVEFFGWGDDASYSDDEDGQTLDENMNNDASSDGGESIICDFVSYVSDMRAKAKREETIRKQMEEEYDSKKPWRKAPLKVKNEAAETKDDGHDEYDILVAVDLVRNVGRQSEYGKFQRDDNISIISDTDSIAIAQKALNYFSKFVPHNYNENNLMESFLENETEKSVEKESNSISLNVTDSVDMESEMQKGNQDPSESSQSSEEDLFENIANRRKFIPSDPSSRKIINLTQFGAFLRGKDRERGNAKEVKKAGASLDEESMDEESRNDEENNLSSENIEEQVKPLDITKNETDGDSLSATNPINSAGDLSHESCKDQSETEECFPLKKEVAEEDLDKSYNSFEEDDGLGELEGGHKYELRVIERIRLKRKPLAPIVSGLEFDESEQSLSSVQYRSTRKSLENIGKDVESMMKSQNNGPNYYEKGNDKSHVNKWKEWSGPYVWYHKVSFVMFVIFGLASIGVLYYALLKLKNVNTELRQRYWEMKNDTDGNRTNLTDINTTEESYKDYELNMTETADPPSQANTSDDEFNIGPEGNTIETKTNEVLNRTHLFESNVTQTHLENNISTTELLESLGNLTQRLNITNAPKFTPSKETFEEPITIEERVTNSRNETIKILRNDTESYDNTDEYGVKQKNITHQIDTKNVEDSIVDNIWNESSNENFLNISIQDYETLLKHNDQSQDQLEFDSSSGKKKKRNKKQQYSYKSKYFG